MVREFKLPDVGEGVAEGEIRKWLVREGEEVREFQPIAEIMTDKVNVEMTSPFTGKIVKFTAKEGEVVKVGQSILQYESEGEEAEKPPVAPPAPISGRITRRQSSRAGARSRSRQHRLSGKGRGSLA